MKVAIYARISIKDKNRESISLDTQIDKCRALAKEHDLRVDRIYKDDGFSRTDNNRPAYREMLAALEDKEFGGVLVYDQDRFSGSDDGEFLRVVAQLTFRDQFLIDCHGYDSRAEVAPLLGALKSGMSSLEVQKLRRRTCDALRQRAKDGYCAGGVPYGYRTQLTSGGFKELVKYEQEAAVVRRIYKMAAEGLSTRSIANELNRLGVPSSPRRKRVRRKWMHSSVRVILRNRVYVGELIWNRHKVKRPPGTNKKLRIPVPEAEWIRVHKEELRVIDDKLWRQVRARIEAQASSSARQRAAGKNTGGTRYSRLLSGLLKCDKCGFAYVLTDARSYGCASHRSGGPHACANALRVKRSLAEDKILRAVKDELLTPDVVQRMRRYMQEYVRERKRELSRSGDGPRIEKELRAVEQRIENVVAAMTEGGLAGSPALASQLKRLEEQQVELNERLASLSGRKDLDRLPDIIPGAVERYRTQVEKMEQLGEDPNPRDVISAREWLRGNLGDIRLVPHRDGYLVAHVGLQERALALVAGDACYRWHPGPGSNRRPSA